MKNKIDGSKTCQCKLYSFRIEGNCVPKRVCKLDEPLHRDLIVDSRGNCSKANELYVCKQPENYCVCLDGYRMNGHGDCKLDNKILNIPYFESFETISENPKNFAQTPSLLKEQNCSKCNENFWIKKYSDLLAQNKIDQADFESKTKEKNFKIKQMFFACIILGITVMAMIIILTFFCCNNWTKKPRLYQTVSTNPPNNQINL